MQYQISYFSPGGYAESLTKAFCRHLPGDTYVSSLEREDTPYADIQLVGFDFAGTSLNAIPLSVMEYLDKLEEKTIFLFATLPFQPNDVLERRVHNNLQAFLPRSCDFRGLYLCPAQPPEALLEELKAVISQHPENSRAQYWLDRCREAVGHPDKADLQGACQFMKHVLQLQGTAGKE